MLRCMFEIPMHVGNNSHLRMFSLTPPQILSELSLLCRPINCQWNLTCDQDVTSVYFLNNNGKLRIYLVFSIFLLIIV